VSRRIALDIENELSERELQLLVHATRGLTDQAIANELGISLATIATYWGRIRIKLGPLNRTELVARYLEYKSTEEIFLLLNEASMLRRQLETTKTEDFELMLALNHLPDAVALVDEQANYIYVNGAYCRITASVLKNFKDKISEHFSQKEDMNDLKPGSKEYWRIPKMPNLPRIDWSSFVTNLEI